MKDLPSDPRTFCYLRLAVLFLEKSAQREVREERTLRIANEWDWLQSEVLTVTPDPDRPGMYLIIEGQHRGSALFKIATPDQLVPCMIVSAETVAERARLARQIARGRRGHSAIEQWRVAVRGDLPYESAAQAVVESLGLEIGGSASATMIRAVASVQRIIHHELSPVDGADRLRLVLTVLMRSFPEDEEPARRFDAILIDIVNALIARNTGRIDIDRLVKVMGSRLVRTWIAEAETGTAAEKMQHLADSVMRRYNSRLSPGRRLQW